MPQEKQYQHCQKTLASSLTQPMQLKNTAQKKVCLPKQNAALDRWAKLRQAAEAEEELKEWITQTYGRRH